MILLKAGLPSALLINAVFALFFLLLLFFFFLICQQDMSLCFPFVPQESVLCTFFYLFSILSSVEEVLFHLSKHEKNIAITNSLPISSVFTLLGWIALLLAHSQYNTMTDFEATQSISNNPKSRGLSFMSLWYLNKQQCLLKVKCALRGAQCSLNCCTFEFQSREAEETTV